jgi:hypothetical protein
MMFYRSPKFVPGKHATMITQEGVSPSTITNWANSLRGLVIWDIENNDLADAQIGGLEIIVKIVPGTDWGLLYYI